MQPSSVTSPKGGVRLDVRRAVREGQFAGAGDALPVSWADLCSCEDRLRVEQARLRGGQTGGSGFLDLDWTGWACESAEQVAADLARETDVLVVLGMGGSALGARAIASALAPNVDATAGRVEVLDTVDPAVVESLCLRLDPRRTAVAVVSKSGRTVETLALLRVFLAWLRGAVGDSWVERVVVVTEPGEGPLACFAAEYGVAALPIPLDVGGRFSVLTAVGQLPAAYLGADCRALRSGAEAMKSRVVVDDLASNPAWQLAALHRCWWGSATTSTLLIYCDRLEAFGRWFRQLLAESLGKKDESGRVYGYLPVVGRGPADQHSQLQLWTHGPRNSLFTVLRVGEVASGSGLELAEGPGSELFPALADRGLASLLEAERRGTTAALIEAGLPVVDLEVPRVDAESLGGLFVLFETAVALLGLSWGIDPFDQPGVDSAKGYAAALLGAPGLDDEVARLRDLLADPGDLS